MSQKDTESTFIAIFPLFHTVRVTPQHSCCAFNNNAKIEQARAEKCCMRFVSKEKHGRQMTELMPSVSLRDKPCVDKTYPIIGPQIEFRLP